MNKLYSRHPFLCRVILFAEATLSCHISIKLFSLCRVEEFRPAGELSGGKA